MTTETTERETGDALGGSRLEAVVMPPTNEQVAVRGIDNWDGERNQYLTIGFVDSLGLWRDLESGTVLLQYQGDEIIEWWPLTPGTGRKAA